MKSETPLTAEQQNEIEKMVHNAAKEKRILCSGAQAIAKSLGIPSQEVGRIANELNIKINKCQLGCF
jgi:DNA invertase Pin-like site-specific DNA recombinase